LIGAEKTRHSQTNELNSQKNELRKMPEGHDSDNMSEISDVSCFEESVKNKRDHHNSIYVQRSDGVSADIGSVSCVKK
jgi:hypothetical protein